MVLSASWFRASGLGGLGAAVLLVVSGCSGADSDNEEQSSAGTTPSFLAVYDAEDPGGDASLMRGVLRADEGCLYLEPEVGDGDRILLFPSDEVTEAGGDEYRFQYQGKEYEDGDHIEVGGGGTDDLARAVENENVTAPDSCNDNTRVFWIASE